MTHMLFNRKHMHNIHLTYKMIKKITEHKQQPNQYKEQYQQIKPNQNYINITPTYEIQGYHCRSGRFYQPASGIF